MSTLAATESAFLDISSFHLRRTRQWSLRSSALTSAAAAMHGESLKNVRVAFMLAAFA